MEEGYLSYKETDGNKKNVLWYLQKLDDVAGSKHPMSDGELVWLRRRKIRS
jgi:hypothetical protein